MNHAVSSGGITASSNASLLSYPAKRRNGVQAYEIALVSAEIHADVTSVGVNMHPNPPPKGTVYDGAVSHDGTYSHGVA